MSPSPPELFPQRPVRSDFARVPSYRARRVVTVLILVVLIAAGLHFGFGWPSFGHPGEIATIKAEGAWKQRPEQPGGMDIPNQNVQVYQALDSKDDTKPEVEHLLPPPEVPQPVTSAAPPTSIAPSPAAKIETLAPPKLEIDTITPSAAAPAPPVSAAAIPSPPPVAAVSKAPPPVNPAPAPATASAKTPALVKAIKTKAPTIAQVLKDVASGSKTGRAVQLASVQDEASAKAMAQQLQNRYTSILGTAQLHVVEAHISGKGTYYRVESPPLPNDRASGICDALKKVKAGCILVRP